MKTKNDWLYRLRRCRQADTLEKVSDHLTHTLEGAELDAFMAAADHRRAEIAAGRLYDRIPSHVWRLVR